MIIGQPRESKPTQSKKPLKPQPIEALEKARPRIQRAFFHWLVQNRHRLALDLLIKKRTDRYADFSFVGINHAISAGLSDHSLSVVIEYEGECLDMLISLDCVIKHGRAGYFCDLCEDYHSGTYPGEEFTKVFPTRAEVWAADLFEPFLEWVNDKLAPARWLGLYGTEGATWARLEDKPPEGKGAACLIALLPCRRGSTSIIGSP